MIDDEFPATSHSSRFTHPLPLLRINAYHFLQGGSHPSSQTTSQILKEKLNRLQRTYFEDVGLVIEYFEEKGEYVLADGEDGFVVVEADVDFGRSGDSVGVGIGAIVGL